MFLKKNGDASKLNSGRINLAMIKDNNDKIINPLTVHNKSFRDSFLILILDRISLIFFEFISLEHK